jgi:hypothetical protein
VTRADREHVPGGRAFGPSRAMVHLLVAAVALVAGAAVGSVAQSSPVQLRPAHLTVAAHPGDGALGTALLPPASAHPARAPGLGSVPGSAPDLPLTAALLGSLLLAPVRVPACPLQAARALPQRRGPPSSALTDRIL